MQLRFEVYGAVQCDYFPMLCPTPQYFEQTDTSLQH